MLYQKSQTNQGRIRIIAFWSKSWNNAQRNYSAPQQEFLAAKLAMEYFRTYLYGRCFTLVTDCRGITFMLSKKEPSAMMQRYITAMRNYIFDLEHLPGIRNVLPDVLSRRHSGLPTATMSLNAITRSKKRISLVELPSENNPEPETLETRQNEQHDDNSSPLPNVVRGKAPVEQFEENNQPITEMTGTEMEDPDDRLMNDGGSTENRRKIIMAEHLAGHSGRENMYKSLVDKGFHWKTMRSECGQVAKECLQCLRFNVEQHGFHPLTSIRAKLPMDHIAMDHFTMNIPSGEFYAVLLIVDVCTGFVFLRPVRDYSAREAIKACIDIFTLFGFPRIIQSDNGTAFVAELTKQFFKEVGVDQRTVSAYHPRANGAAETRVKSAKNLAWKVLDGAITDWSSALPMINYWLNQRIQEKTGSSPFMYMFARRGNAFKDYRDEEGKLTMDSAALMERYRVIKEIIFPGLAARKNRKQDAIEDRFNKNKKIIDTHYFPPGAVVMVKDPHRKNKHEPAYTGPYAVLRRTKGNSYVLLDHGSNSLFPRDVAPEHMKLVSATPMNDKEDGERFDVEAIMNHRGRKGNYEYLVRWKGYGEENDSWEPAKQFDSPALIEQYWKRRKGSKSDLKGHMDQTARL
jgi:transposase InsO family protein